MIIIIIIIIVIVIGIVIVMIININIIATEVIIIGPNTSRLIESDLPPPWSISCWSRATNC